MSNYFKLLQKQSNRIPELDGLRGIAILLVIFNHYLNFPLSNIPILKIPFTKDLLRYSWTGVDLFFVLSGFLIGGILIDQQKSRNFFQVFYLRRICRIFPLYFGWLAVYFLIISLFSTWTNNFAPPDLFNYHFPIWTYATFLQNFLEAKQYLPINHWLCVTWSLAVEEQFYLIAPSIIFFTPKLRTPWIVLGLMICAPIIRLVLYNLTNQGSYAFFLMPCRMDSLFVGILIAYMYRSSSAMAFCSKYLNLVYATLFSSFFLLMFTPMKYCELFSKEKSVLGLSLIALFYACLLIIILIHKKGILGSLTRLKILRRLGIISYGMYVYHFAINSLLHGLIRKDIPFYGNIRDLLVTVLAFIVTVTLAYISWILFERPIVQFGHKFKYQLPHKDNPLKP